MLKLILFDKVIFEESWINRLEKIAGTVQEQLRYVTARKILTTVNPLPYIERRCINTSRAQVHLVRNVSHAQKVARVLGGDDKKKIARGHEKIMSCFILRRGFSHWPTFRSGFYFARLRSQCHETRGIASTFLSTRAKYKVPVTLL